MSSLYTIGQLTERVSRVLMATGGVHQTSGRIRAVPDTRTLRYYTTLGILDAPLELRGRTAYYGRRHLVQAVAIKRLQTRGESLVEIQQRLVGAGDDQLEAWAEIPKSLWDQLEQGPLSTSESLDAVPDAVSWSGEEMAFWAVAPTARVDSSNVDDSVIPGQVSMQWEVMPGVRIVWDDAREAGLAEDDPEWRQALAGLGRAAERIRKHRQRGRTSQ